MKIKYLFIYTILLSSIYAECSDLNQTDCLYYSQYCTWSEETNSCNDNSGGGDIGPYEYVTITESQGLRNGPDYRDGVVYYPIDGNPPYKSIVLTPGFGGGSTEMSSWAEFYASHGFIAMRIGPNDEINDSHEMRGNGLIDGIESIRQENSRISSPLYRMIDEHSFSVSGYSMGGGASHNAAMIDSSIKALISLNPTVIFEDCELCPALDYEGENYCICLVPQFVDHSIPSLIFAGEIEINELPSYQGMLGQNIYINMPETTEKVMFEGAGSGHGFSAYPYGEIQEYALNWLKYQVLNDESSCNLLLEVPLSASQYLTNLTCSILLPGDINEDFFVNVQDILLAINFILNNEYNNISDINLDGSVDVLDILLIVNIILN